jgi:hypothetical protein
MTSFLSVLTLLLMAPVGQQSVGVEQSARTEPSGLRFLFGYGVDRHGLWQVEVYVRQGDRESAPAFVARRSLATPDGPESFTWTDSQGCPALEALVLATTDIPAVRIEPPGAPDLGRPSPPVASGAAFRVWGRGRQMEGSFAGIEMSANSGPLAEWVMAADLNLKDCWRPG